ncbi:LamG domain-containing protein [Natrononativus amylolyticus]|uniref:LamG domain-containing protein n=1 Tax=Natrononativus amylolyticus TaxID=2963434 RepID=UPI0020CE7B45|nr:LamG domain-containing protein [Natrononativus amylolyticus]
MRIEGQYAITLVRDGVKTGAVDPTEADEEDTLGYEIQEIEAITDISPQRVHSGVSDWQVQVPVDRDLEDWAWSTAYITRDEQIVYVGTLKAPDTNPNDATSTLTGPDSAGDLERGYVEFVAENTTEWRAIRACWHKAAPSWDITVVRPAQGRPIDRAEYDGSPLEVLQDIHEDLGFRFIVDRKRPRKATSFRRKQAVRPQTWQTVNSTTSRDVYDYANSAIVRGARDGNGDRYEGEYIDENEVARLMAEYGFTEEEATVVYPDKDASLVSDRQCETKARSLVEERIDEEERDLEIETFPVFVDPGPAYIIEDTGIDNERRVGPYSLFFDGDDSSYVELPAATWDGLTDSGSLTVWVRPGVRAETDWEFRPIGTDSSRVVVSDAERIEWVLGSTSDTATVASFPDGDAPDDWAFVHVDWLYDADSDETVIRAGHGAENRTITDEDTFEGRLGTPTDVWWLGRQSTDRFRGYIDDPALSRRLEPTHYRALERGGEIPARYRRHRWTLSEGPYRNGSTIWDHVGGQHGTNHGAEPAGNPKLLEGSDFSVSQGTADGHLEFETIVTAATERERLRREQRRIKRGL